MVEGPGDEFLPSVGGDEYYRHVRDLEDVLHQRYAVGIGQHQVQEDQLGTLLFQQAQSLLRVPGHHRPVTRRGQCVADIP